MTDAKFGMERDKVYLNVWLVDGSRVDGFAHMPKNIREQDFLELNNKRMLALTEAKVYIHGDVVETPVVILNREQIKMVIPQQK